jgi:uncharacterized membrane protein YkvA (DUF1232 family)
MSDAIDPKYLEVFPAWLRSLGEDAAALGSIVESTGSESTRRNVTVGLNYIFKSLDLIPDGIDDLGYLDDAFVLRVASAFAVAEDASAKDGIVGRLAADAEPLKEFLGADYERLEAYVKNLHKGAARGRTVDDIVGDEGIRRQFTQEVAAWAKEYQAPSFTRDPKTLLKLKSFLNAKLP